MNAIIIAALALLVLIVIAVIFAGRFNIFGTTTRDCSSLGGNCRPSGCLPNEAPVGDSSGTDCNGQCCVQIYEDSS